MEIYRTIKTKLLVCYTIVFFIVVILICSGLEPMLIAALAVWLFLMAYALHDVKRNLPLFCFLCSFFVFLFGREIVYRFCNINRTYLYLEPYNNISFFLLGLSLICLTIGYNTSSRIQKKKRKKDILSLIHVDSGVNKSKTYQKICAGAFFICYIASLIVVINKILFVRSSGYLASYIDNGTTNKYIGYLSYISSFLIVAISLYLATRPSKKRSIEVLFLYELYGGLTLFTGHRYIFIAISMYTCIYLCIRHKSEGGWIKRKNIITVIILLPILVLLLTAMDSIRLGKKYEFTSIFNSFVQFLNDQGGSVNVIKRIFYYEPELQDMHYVAFSNIRTVLFENSIVRSLFGIKVYSGNSIEHALYGNSLAHRLSYYEYGAWYLEGRGVGSCYIAELYHDFGVLGVILGSGLYGVILGKINNINFHKPFTSGILLSMIYYVLLGPRGEFDAAIGNIFSISSILFIIIIQVLTKIFTANRIKPDILRTELQYQGIREE